MKLKKDYKINNNNKNVLNIKIIIKMQINYINKIHLNKINKIAKSTTT